MLVESYWRVDQWDEKLSKTKQGQDFSGDPQMRMTNFAEWPNGVILLKIMGKMGFNYETTQEYNEATD